MYHKRRNVIVVFTNHAIDRLNERSKLTQDDIRFVISQQLCLYIGFEPTGTKHYLFYSPIDKCLFVLVVIEKDDETVIKTILPPDESRWAISEETSHNARQIALTGSQPKSDDNSTQVGLENDRMRKVYFDCFYVPKGKGYNQKIKNLGSTKIDVSTPITDDSIIEWLKSRIIKKLDLADEVVHIRYRIGKEGTLQPLPASVLL